MGYIQYIIILDRQVVTYLHTYIPTYTYTHTHYEV